MIDQLVAALGQDLGLTSKEIADAVWLALQIDASGLPVRAEDGGVAAGAKREGDRSQSTNRDFSNSDLEPAGNEGPDKPEPPKAELTTPSPDADGQDGFGSDLMIKVPDARSLREPLALAKSLKPLLQKVTAGLSTVLDEAATVERIAGEGIWMPVLKPNLEPWLDLALVVDDSLSMHLWQRTIAELQRLLGNYGVFRDVRVWSLVADEPKTDQPGELRLRPRSGGKAAQKKTLHRPSELVDPGGRRLILVATDCVSEIWHDGTMLPALKLWSASGPMAIVQMLPEWLWARTALGFASAVRLHSLMPGVPNQRLDLRGASPWDEVDLDAGIRVPVVTLEPEPFLAWAKVVSSKQGAWCPGFIFEPEGAVGASQFEGLDSEESAEQRVQRFRATASPMARRLAGLLAAAPVISLPIVRIIRDRLLPESRQMHVAEVFLGGILTPLSEIQPSTNPDAVQYDFGNSLRALLLESMPVGDTLDVLEEVSSFVANYLGLSKNTFVASLRNSQYAEEYNIAEYSHPFAKVTASILHKLGGKYSELACELEQANRNSVYKASASDLRQQKNSEDWSDEPTTISSPVSKAFTETVQIVISYRGQPPDSDLAEEFYRALSAAGHDVFMAAESIRLGDNWSARIDQALKNCDYFVLLLSPQSASSEMVTEEVRRARELRDTRGLDKPKLLPIRVNFPFESPMNYDLRGYLHRIQQGQWRSPEDTPHVLQNILEIVEGQQAEPPRPESQFDPGPLIDQPGVPPVPVAPPEVPGGQVDLASAYYVERPPLEANCYETILKPGALIRIKAPRQMGKTSLMSRILRHAEQGDTPCLTVRLSFQIADAAIFSDLDKFLRWFCASIGRRLKLPNKLEEYWDAEIFGAKDNCTAYFEEYLLPNLASPLVLGLDEVDMVFERPNIAADFMGLLRAWHESAKVNSLWKQLRVVVVHSTEVYIPMNVNQSPFNAGLPIELVEFSTAQVQDLAQRHGLSWGREDTDRLMVMVGGHPYLVRVALYAIAREEITLNELLEIAPTEESLYSDHLRRHLWNLRQRSEMLGAIQRVMGSTGGVRMEPMQAFQLHSMGLVHLRGNEVVPRCDLYRLYFNERLR